MSGDDARARARQRAHELLHLDGFECRGGHRSGCERAYDYILAADEEAAALRERVAAVERERDAYKRAKAENDERFMTERDAALAAKVEAERRLGEAVGLLGRAVKYATEDRAQTAGVTRLARLVAEVRKWLAAPLPGDGAETVGEKGQP